jgi:hypothetical protein
MVDAGVFGVGFFGDAATIHKCPLVNMFASSFNVPAMLVDIVDCTEQVEGRRKEGWHIYFELVPPVD